MELKDIIEGEIYYAEYFKSKWAVIKASGRDFENSPGYYFEKDKFHFLKNNCWSCNINIRLATNSEKLILNACIKANKFIPLSEVKEENILENLEIW